MNHRLAIESPAQPHAFRRHMRRIALSNRRARDDGDAKLFALSFAAFFVCFSTFLL